MKRLFVALLPLLTSAVAFAAQAATAPDVVVSKMTEQVLAEARQLNGGTDVTKVRTLVENAILPNVDFASMTSRAVGVKWRTATDAQRTQLMAGFQSLLVKTYAGALSQARDAKFKVGRVIPLDAETSEVRSEVAAAAGGQPIAIAYRMALENDQWKVTDVGVAGVWLVAAYRSQFSQVLQNADVDGLIRVLDEKSRAR